MAFKQLYMSSLLMQNVLPARKVHGPHFGIGEQREGCDSGTKSKEDSKVFRVVRLQYCPRSCWGTLRGRSDTW